MTTIHNYIFEFKKRRILKRIINNPNIDEDDVFLYAEKYSDYDDILADVANVGRIDIVKKYLNKVKNKQNVYSLLLFIFVIRDNIEGVKLMLNQEETTLYSDEYYIPEETRNKEIRHLLA